MNKKIIAGILVSVLSIASSSFVYAQTQPKTVTEIIVSSAVKKPTSFDATRLEVDTEGLPSLESFISMNQKELCENLLRHGLELPQDYANHQEELAEPFIFNYFHTIISEKWTEVEVNNWVITINSSDSQIMMENLYKTMQQIST